MADNEWRLIESGYYLEVNTSEAKSIREVNTMYFASCSQEHCLDGHGNYN